MLWTCCVCFLLFAPSVLSDGLLFLYRPRDISSECVNSQHLRYDLSFGMGMSDTVTLVFRTLSNFDYECEVEVSTESIEEHLLVVIRFPNSVANNCASNRNAFTIIKKNRCQRLCDMVRQRDFSSQYYVITLRKEIRFRFISNSSVNFDMNANLYQVTATAARRAPRGGCSRRNETTCSVNSTDYCFTSGAVCDGINNCGVVDWFDERKSQCGLPVDKLGFAPVVAVLAAVLCTLLVIGRGILYCLPSTSASFFIFNANEDNRLCIDTVFEPPVLGRDSSDPVVRTSIIPIFSDSSTESNKSEEVKVTVHESDTVDAVQSVNAQTVEADRPRRITERNVTIRSVSATLGRKLRRVTGHHRRVTNAIAHVKDIPAASTTKTL